MYLGSSPPTLDTLIITNQFNRQPDDYHYIIYDTGVGSYDPNDKIVNYGSALIYEHLNDYELKYTIRFQNTGTDTAFQVIIVDKIKGNLDPESIRIIVASHLYKWRYSENGIATFVFDNIMLPDSNVNEPASHGFVMLGLRPRQDIVVGDSVYNHAAIYFDYNEPVITSPSVLHIAALTSV